MHGAEQGEESARRDTEDLMFNKMESLWHGIWAGPSLNIKEPGGELDGWRIPSEIKTETEKGVMRKGKGGIWAFLGVCAEVVEWQKKQAAIETHSLQVETFLSAPSLTEVGWYKPVTHHKQVIEKSPQLLSSNSLKALRLSTPALTSLPPTFLGFTWLLEITIIIIEPLSNLSKLGKAHRSASLQMPLATMLPTLHKQRVVKELINDHGQSSQRWHYVRKSGRKIHDNNFVFHVLIMITSGKHGRFTVLLFSSCILVVLAHSDHIFYTIFLTKLIIFKLLI